MADAGSGTGYRGIVAVALAAVVAGACSFAAIGQWVGELTGVQLTELGLSRGVAPDASIFRKVLARLVRPPSISWPGRSSFAGRARLSQTLAGWRAALPRRGGLRRCPACSRQACARCSSHGVQSGPECWSARGAQVPDQTSLSREVPQPMGDRSDRHSPSSGSALLNAVRPASVGTAGRQADQGANGDRFGDGLTGRLPGLRSQGEEHGSCRDRIAKGVVWRVNRQ